jgi:5-methylcytosine-specific restriction protein A
VTRLFLLRCGKHHGPTPGLCSICQAHFERDKSRRRRRTPRERQRRQDLIAAHVAIHGWTCPGFECQPHPATDLTADHLLPGNEEGELRVLCRSCNSSRGAGYPPTRDGRPEPPHR